MSKLSAFIFITLNGYMEGPEKGNIYWHKHGKEENEYAAASLQAQNIILFGRVTYEMMASYWPTEMAMQNDPGVAEGMNNSEKIVFSKSMDKAEWNNTRIIKENMEDEIRSLKKNSEKNITILGSGSIVTQLAKEDLIDEYQIMIDPVAIGSGNSIFKGISHQLDLQLVNSKVFKSGVILLSYQPAKK